MTRAEMIALIKSVADPEFQGEIQHFMEVGDREYEYDELCALMDAESAAEEGKNKHVLKICRLTLIAIGFYRIMMGDEVAETITTRGYTAWNFKMAGVPYTTDTTVEEFAFAAMHDLTEEATAQNV